MQIRLETRGDGLQRLVTQGLNEFNQQEFALELLGDVTENEGNQVLRYIGDYVASSRQQIMADETMRYGWSTLHFTQDAGTDILTVEELAEPLSISAETYVRGAVTAIRILRDQDETVKRNGLRAPGHHPHRSEKAVICRRVSPNSDWRVLVFDRVQARQDDQSGWFIGCGSSNHDHNDVNELATLHLVYLVDREPRTLSYLALPGESRVVFEQRRTIVFGPGEEEGHLDRS
jgi:hypothetical protein